MNLHLTNRKLRLETLEERALLAVTAGGFEQAVPLPAPTGETVWVVNTTDDPADWDTADEVLSLREAIGRAEDGDTVVFDGSLAGGTVTLNGSELEILLGITIDAASIGGITIDADGASRVFYVNGENGSSPVELISLTITGGNANYDGGGIYNWYGTLTLTDSIVSGNTAGNNGGGIYNWYGTLTLTDSIVSGNTAGNNGGGIYNGYGTLTLTYSTVSGNTASIGGGGIYNEIGTLTLTNSSISENTASSYAGGIYNYSGIPLTITNSTVSGNTASSYAGGIYNENGSTLTLTNSTVLGNSANYGGGIYNGSDSTLTLMNSTVSGNSANYGGGIYNYYYDYGSGKLTLINTIVSLNDAEDQDSRDIYGPYTKVNGIVGDDPGFVTAPIFEAGKLVNADEIDLSLASYSFAIDAGTNDAVETETDLAGNPRIFAAWKEPPRVDIGAYEYQEQIDPPAPIVVTTLLDVVDESDGLISLREAIQLADIYGVVTFDASLANRAIILEGGELVISTDLTIDARGIGGVMIDADDKSRVFHISQNAAVELAGLTINGGNADYGAGIYNEGALTLTESEISWNIADSNGGGVYNRGTMSLVDSIVMGNTAKNGAGIYNYSGTLTVTNSAVSENAASNYGGGIRNSGTLTVANSAVSGNSASEGGGIYGEGTIVNSTVSENSASYNGGGIYGWGTIINSIVSGNTVSSNWSGYGGGGIYGGGTIINSTVSGNTAYYGGGIRKNGNLTLINTIVSFNYANRFENDIYNDSDPITGGSNIVGLDPGFVAAPVFENGKLVNFDELDLSLTAGSYAIDHGANDAVETETDLAGNPRIAASWKETATVDIGAYEYQARVQKGEIETPSTVVTTLFDIVDETDGLISLREAVLYAGAGDTVTFDAALAGRRIVLDGAELAIDKSITIDASAVGGITIDGGGRSRVFYVGSVTAGLAALTVQNGRAYYGGGIYNTGTLALTNVVITGCYAEYGGGIYNSSGRLTATNATVWGNSVYNSGRDLYNSGRAYFYNSIVAQNANYSIAVSGGLLYAYNTLSAFTNWNQSKNCPAYDSGKPLFTNPGKGDYTLAEKSQAIDVGNNTYVTTETDLAGNARIVNEIVDLGAYEFAVPAQKLETPAILNNSRNTFISYGANRHNVVWSDIGHAAAYEFGYSANGGSTWTYVQTPYANYLLTGLTYGAEMTYRVRALSGAGYIDSEWSEARSFAVCPMDINGNGDISAADRAALAAAWLSEEGEANFLPAADINGDGEVSAVDRLVMSADWLKDATDPTLLYPRPLAADAALADYAPADLSIGLDLF